ncbi:MAG: hypothetical protein ABSC91_11255 [Candidatus Bathyarchaeia archaeon]|jgi:hypothetical protein
MVDTQTISIAIASASIVVGVVYYALQIRHQDKMRHMDLFMRLYSIWGSEDMLNAHRRFMVLKVENYDSWVKKEGPVTEHSQVNTDIDRIGWFFNLMGFIVKEKIVHIKLVDELLGYWVIKNWETIKPLVDGWRKQYNIPESYRWFEYLCNEMKKRQQQK